MRTMSKDNSLWPIGMIRRLRMSLIATSCLTFVDGYGDSNDDEWQPVIHVVARSETTTDAQRAHPKQEKAKNNRPLMYHLAKTWSWTTLASRIVSHPEEVSTSHVDEQTGDTILHWVIAGKPPSQVVRDLLALCPELARTPNHVRDLPLHVACSCRASEEVILVMLYAYPEAAGLPDHQKRYPLHLLCDYGHPETGAFRALLCTPAGAATANLLDPIYGRKPLSTWNARTNITQCQQQRDRMQLIVKRLQQKAVSSSTNQKKGSACDFERTLRSEMDLYGQYGFWRTAALLMVAEHEASPILNDLTPGRILRAALANPNCPPSLQEYAILVNHDYLKHVDPVDGRVPLHWAAQCAGSDNVLTMVEFCPESACIRDHEGNVPLQLALQNTALSWSLGLCAMVESNPEAVAQVEGLKDSLIPCLLTRLRPTTVFAVIRSVPNAFSGK